MHIFSIASIGGASSLLYQVAMEAAAAEDSEAKAKDIAALMARRRGETPPPEGDGPKDAPPLKGGDPLLQPGNIMRSA